MTGIEGPVGGMEYPMLTFVRDFGQARSVYETLNHEIGHMWFPMMVGSNEPSYPWMDEGLTTYIEGYATGDFWDDPEYWRNDKNAYLRVAGIEQETPIMRHADLHGPDGEGTYAFAAYWKPATLLRALEAVIGQELVWESLRRYADNWIYRHPDPLDFFNTVEAVAGQDLDWFWHPFWYETAYMDQALEGVEVGAGEVRIMVSDLGSAPMPVILELALSNGESLRETVPVDVWLAGARDHEVRITVPAGTTVETVQIDPEGAFPDVDPDNNVWDL
jgi:aminopeptidase N